MPDNDVHELMHTIRARGLLEKWGITLTFDFGPRSNKAKEVQRLAFGGKGKGGGRCLFGGKK